MTSADPKSRIAPRSSRLDMGLVLILTPVLWGATFPAAKLALEDLHPLSFMFWTRLLGFLTILVALPFLGGRSGEPGLWRRLLLPGSLLGGLIFLGYVLQTVGLELTTATNAGFITGLYVVFVPLIWLVAFGRAPGRAIWIAVAISVVGLGLLSTDSLSALELHSGDLLVLAGAAAWAAHIAALGHFAPRFPSTLLSLAQMAATAAFHLVAAAFVGFEPAAAWDAAPLLLITGVLGSGVGYTLQLVAQQELSAPRAAVILSGESLASAILSVLWLGERLALHQWVGAALILAAMITSELGARRKIEPSPVAG